MENWKHRILITNKEKANIFYFARMFNIHPITSYLIYARGHQNEESIHHFLYPSFNQFSNPFLLKDLKKGVERLLNAISNGEKIGILGDYDADGITSTSMLGNALSSLGAFFIPVIPLRKDGYGLSKQAVNHFKEQGISLIVTLDNGTSCLEEIHYAKTLGIDTIVVDHHDILKEHPAAYAFINPKRSDDTSNLEYLCGAGVTLYFIEGIYKSLSLPWDIYIQEYIELATIGTICDMVPLIKENRYLCDMGLKKMNYNPAPFMKFFKKIVKTSIVDSSKISFDIGPLINGFGRYDNPNLIVPLLMRNEANEWLEKKCLSLNQSRKKISFEQTVLAESLLEEQHLYKHDILHIHGDIHKGILGLIAAKFSKKYKKPTLISTLDGTGSARSVPNSNLSIIDLLNAQKQYFAKYGGHHSAAGFTLKSHLIEEFHHSISSVKLDKATTTQTIYFDMELPIQHFTPDLHLELALLEPFGMGNPKPVFKSTETFFQNIELFGKYDTHLKCTVGDAKLFSFFVNFQEMASIGFDTFNMLYSPLNDRQFTIESLISDKKDPFPFVI